MKYFECFHFKCIQINLTIDTATSGPIIRTTIGGTAGTSSNINTTAIATIAGTTIRITFTIITITITIVTITTILITI